MEKYHKQDVAPIEQENERDENYEASNPQIDCERTRNNYRFTPHFGKTYTEFINGRIRLMQNYSFQISHVFRYQNQVYEFAVATRFFDEGIIYDRAFLCDYCAGI